jgi:peroxidase
MWRQQFEALRDGDRFFYGIDRELVRIGEDFGITYRHTLAKLSLNSGARVPADVFEVAPSDD